MACRQLSDLRMNNSRVGRKMEDRHYRKVSLVLTTYNCINNFRTTMDSILAQDYPNIEIAIKDGASTDGTLELIEKYGKKLDGRLVWESEPDKGIYDAMNEGYRMSSGEIIAFFNDRFMNDHAVSDMVKAIEDFGTDCIGAHADLVYMDGERVVRKWQMGRGYFRRGWMPGHPTLYLKREVYEQYGLYDMSYRCSADYEFMIRALCGREDRLAYVPEVIVAMYYGGTSTQGLDSYFVSLREAHAGLRKNGVKGALWIDILRTWKVLGQFIKAKQRLK